MGTAGYQSLVGRMLPLRGLAAPFRTWSARFLTQVVSHLQPRCRAWMRNRRWAWHHSRVPATQEMPLPDAEITLPARDGRGHELHQQMLLTAGWRAGGDEDPWDLERDGVRVLFATERGDGEVKQVLARIWGARSLGLDGESD